MSKIKYLQKRSLQKNKRSKRHKDKIIKMSNNMNNNNLRSNLNKKSKEKGKILGNNNLLISKSSK